MAETVGREAAVRALKEFSKASWADSYAELGDALKKETDRGAIIIAATMVEDVLGKALKRKMSPLSADEEDRLFGPDRPLGSFSARIRMAHAMGLIERDQRIICDLLREMRNACAHSRRPISFKDSALRDVLAVATKGIVPSEILSFKSPLAEKLTLVCLCLWIARSINVSREAAQARVDEILKKPVARIGKRDALLKKLRGLSTPGRRSRRKD